MSAALEIRSRSRRLAVGGGLAYFALFLGVHVALAAEPDGLMPVDVVQLALVGGAAMAVALPRPVGTVTATGAVLALISAAAVGTWALPAVPREPDYRAWVLGAVTFVALGLAFRQRYLEAWLTLICTAGIAIGWSTDVGLGPLVGAGLVVRHFGTLLAGSLISLALARSARSAEAFAAAERSERAATEAARARHVARQAAAQAVLDQAAPLLEQLADGRPLSERDRLELLVVEGALRDQIRAAELVQDGLRQAVATARRRGMDVLLLDEAGTGADERQRFLAAEWLTTELDAAQGRRFVGRLVTREGLARVTAVTEADSRALALPASNRTSGETSRGAEGVTPASRGR